MIPAGSPPLCQSGDPLAAASSSGRGRSHKGPNLVRWIQKCDKAVVGKKLMHYKSSVRGCIFIMKQPIAHAPQFRSFSPNVLPQMAKNIAVELRVRGLAFGGKFKVHNPSNVEKHDEHALGRAAALPRLLQSWGSWALPLQRLLFSLRIIPVDPTLVPSDEAVAKGLSL